MIMIRNATIAASLIAAAGIIVLWVWSYTGRFTDIHADHMLTGWVVELGQSFWAEASKGICRIGVWSGDPSEEWSSTPGWEYEIEFGTLRILADSFQAQIRVPFWLPLGLSLTYPGVAFVRRPVRRWRRRRLDRCISCGYDLRGSVSGLCSECGHPIESNDS